MLSTLFHQLLKKVLHIGKLEEFSKTSKFESPVLIDIIPILANNQQKQEYIIERNAKMMKGNKGEEGQNLGKKQRSLHESRGEKEETKKEEDAVTIVRLM